MLDSDTNIVKNTSEDPTLDLLCCQQKNTQSPLVINAESVNFLTDGTDFAGLDNAATWGASNGVSE